MTTSQTELAAKNLDMEQKAMLVCLYNGQKATPKQIAKVLASYKCHEMMDRFIVPRWNVIKDYLG